MFIQAWQMQDVVTEICRRVRQNSAFITQIEQIVLAHCIVIVVQGRQANIITHGDKCQLLLVITRAKAICVQCPEATVHYKLALVEARSS